MLAGDEFRTLLHTTYMYLGKPEWLDKVTEVVDKGIANDLYLPEVLTLVGTVHCGSTHRFFDSETEDFCRTTGYRSGSFAIIPNLLLYMKPSLESVGISALDKFIANVPVSPDGVMRESFSVYLPNWSGYLAESGLSGENETFAGLRYGNPEQEAPDVPLYIGIERTSGSGEISVELCGRIHGQVVGHASIIGAMYVILKSLRGSELCDGLKHGQRVAQSDSEESLRECLLMAPSTWVGLKNGKWNVVRPVSNRDTHLSLYMRIPRGQCSWLGKLMGTALL